MNGTDLLDEISRRIMKRRGTKTITDSVLAKEIGVTQPNLALWRNKDVTPRQVVNLLERVKKRAVADTMAQTVRPIVEFFQIDPAESKQGAKWELFSISDGNGRDHPFLAGLKARLDSLHGIYVFHDSRGRAIYAGKAQRLSLWTEMNNAYNRDRGEVQSIKRVNHPANRIAFKGLDEQKRQIKRQTVALHDIAHYMSAYEVAEGLIGKFEALIVRTFANDLLNVRMETL
jgi:hypothetical protein